MSSCEIYFPLFSRITITIFLKNLHGGLSRVTGDCNSLFAIF